MDAAYRFAGDLEVHSKELEDELVKTKARLHETKHALFAARRILRQRKAATVTSWGGTGAALASVIALVLYATEVAEKPGILLGLVILAFLFGAICSMRWETVDDGFPEAARPRLH